MPLTSRFQTPWLTSLGSRDAERGGQMRLFAFPYAGGGPLVFRQWPALLPSFVEFCAVHPPGRGARLCDAFHDSLSPMIEELRREIAPHLDRPFAFFGHSLGALVAYELARAVREDGCEPVALFVSGHRSPELPDPNPHLHALPAERFIEKLRALNGTPPELLEARELLEWLMPMLRADFRILETYAYRDGPPLSCPIFAFGGDADPLVSRGELEAWRGRTTGGFALRMFPGDHFYIEQRREEFLEMLARELADLCTAT